MKIFVDKEKCLGCGACVAACSEVFMIDKDGKCKVKVQRKLSCVDQAVDVCPGNAIKVE
ncbi:MAG: ferredoxin [Candidatus Aenigmatarchaeota archaeon]|nr:ferredoxin [Candidatus Aenigmarchaeota archaeon]